MKKISTVFTIPVSALALASCSPPGIDITVSQEGGAQVITLSQDWGLLFNDEKTPCIDRVDVRENGPRGAVVWGFDAETNACVDLDFFNIGEVPRGFLERVSAARSLSGRFTLIVFGIGVGKKEIVLP